MKITAIRKEIGRRIKKVRQLRNMTQGDIAGRVFLTRSSIANIETGRQNITVDTLYEIAEALQVTVVDLLAPNTYETLLIEPTPEPEPVIIKILVNDEVRTSFRVPKWGRPKE